MTTPIDGMFQDFADTVRNPEVPLHELAVLAQELDATVSSDPARADAAVSALSALLDEEAPAVYVVAVLVGGIVQRGADPTPAARLFRRLPDQLAAAAAFSDRLERSESFDAAAAADDVGARAWVDLEQLWRPAIVILSLLEPERRRLQPSLPHADRLGERHPMGVWLPRLLRTPERAPLVIEAPDGEFGATVTGVADLLQLTVLVNAILHEVDPAAVNCALGRGPQVVPGPVHLPFGLADQDGDPLPEGLQFDDLPRVGGVPRVRAVACDPPLVRPIGRAFVCLRAALDVDDSERRSRRGPVGADER